MEPACALAAFLAASSTMLCWVLRLSSASLSNAPQRLRSFGIGLAATHLSLTKPLKSWQALMLESSSLTSNALLGAGAAAAVAAVLALAGAAGAAACSCLPQAASESATLTPSARGFRYGLVMDVPLWMVCPQASVERRC